jgi:hypothetical protein
MPNETDVTSLNSPLPSYVDISKKKKKKTNFKTYTKIKKKKSTIEKLSVKYIGKIEFLRKETFSLLFPEFNVKLKKKKKKERNDSNKK